MKVPEQFVIKGETWKVEVKEHVIVEDELTDGSTDSDLRVIELQKDLEGRKRDHTLLHEWLHAAVHELHVVLEPQQEEVLVDGLAKCLLDNFQIEVK